jgi:hypothetical protein
MKDEKVLLIAIGQQFLGLSREWDRIKQELDQGGWVESQEMDLAIDCSELIDQAIRRTDTLSMLRDALDQQYANEMSRLKMRIGSIEFLRAGWQWYLVAGYDSIVDDLGADEDGVFTNRYLKAGLILEASGEAFLPINELRVGGFQSSWKIAKSLAYRQYAAICRTLSRLAESSSPIESTECDVGNGPFKSGSKCWWSFEGTQINLTPIPYRLLDLLWRKKDRFATKSELAREVFLDESADFINRQTVENHTKTINGIFRKHNVPLKLSVSDRIGEDLTVSLKPFGKITEKLPEDLP